MKSLNQKVLDEIRKFIENQRDTAFIPTKELCQFFNIGFSHFDTQKTDIGNPYEIYLKNLREEVIKCLTVPWLRSYYEQTLTRFAYCDNSGNGYVIELTLYSHPLSDKPFGECTYESLKLGYQLSEGYNFKYGSNGEIETYCFGWAKDFYFDDEWKEKVGIPVGVLSKNDKKDNISKIPKRSTKSAKV